MIDPHITGSYENYDERYDERFGQGYGNEGTGFRNIGGFGYESTPYASNGIDLRANRLFQSLEKAGRYAELDKAKRNEHYRAYLLENFEDTDNEYY